MSDINDDVLCADLSNFALAVNTKPFNVFFLQDAALAGVRLRAGLFQFNLRGVAPRKRPDRGCCQQRGRCRACNTRGEQDHKHQHAQGSRSDAAVLQQVRV